MKRLTIPVFVFMWSVFALNAKDIEKLPLITVSGKAEITIAPDEAVLTLKVSKINKDLQTAKRLNDESVGKILELTRRFSIPPQNVKTTYISVEMKYELVRDANTRIFDENGYEIGKRNFKGYEISKTVIIRLTDISRFEEFFDEILKTDLSEVSSITFETSKLQEIKDTARDMAMKAAREKATAMAAALGQSIGKAVIITEGNTGDRSLRSYGANVSEAIMAGGFSENLGGVLI